MLSIFYRNVPTFLCNSAVPTNYSLFVLIFLSRLVCIGSLKIIECIIIITNEKSRFI